MRGRFEVRVRLLDSNPTSADDGLKRSPGRGNWRRKEPLVQRSDIIKAWDAILSVRASLASGDAWPWQLATAPKLPTVRASS